MLLLAVLAAIWAPVVAAGASSVAPDLEQRFVELTARERTSAAIPAYVVEGDLVEVARRHAERMAAENRLHHNPRLADEVSGWEVVGENVGRGTSADEVHHAFMESPSHRENLLSSEFTQVGIGVHLTDAGEVWVTQVFRRPQAAAAPAEPAPAAAPVAAPADPVGSPRPAPAHSGRSETGGVSAAAAAPAPPPAVQPDPGLLAALTAEQAWPPVDAAAGTAGRDTGRGRIAESPPGDPLAGPVTMPTRVAASLLVLVVAAQTVYVRRYVVGAGTRNDPAVLTGVQLATAKS